MFWLGAIVSLCYIPGITGAYIATQWPVLAIVLSFDLMRTAILPAFEVLPKQPFTIFHAIGLAFVMYAFALWPHSSAPHASGFGVWLVVIMALSVWFGTALASVRELYAGLATGAAVSSLVAVLQYFGIEPVRVISENPAGIYVNSVQQGTVLALVVVALISERMWLWALPLLPGIVLAQSRGAWLALVVGLLGCGVRRLWVFGLVGAVGVFYFFSVPVSSDIQRMYIWRTAWENLTWFGWGPGVFYAIVLPWNGTFSLYPEYAHNDALQLAFEYGVAAVLPFAVIGYALWRTDAKEWPVVLAFVTAGCYSMPLFMPITSFLALVAVGRILCLHGLGVRDGGHRGQHGLSREWSNSGTCGQAVPVESHHSTKG